MTESNALFAVVDLETTGFSPLVGDRILEIGVVRIAGDGSTVDEYATLINPLRDVGPTHVHGITQEDVAQAPTFAEVVGDVLSRLAGVMFVGHNARYDRDFLAAELSSAGIFLPAIPCAHSSSGTASIPSSPITGSGRAARPPASSTAVRTRRSRTPARLRSS